jgi:putative membrane protein
MFLGLIFLILLIVVVVGLVVASIWLIGRGQKLNSNRQNETSPGDEPLEILRRRYARGEISRAEYESMHHDLMAS